MFTKEVLVQRPGWQPKFDLQMPQGGKNELNPWNCPPSSKVVPWHNIHGTITINTQITNFIETSKDFYKASKTALYLTYSHHRLILETLINLSVN